MAEPELKWTRHPRIKAQTVGRYANGVCAGYAKRNLSDAEHADIGDRLIQMIKDFEDVFASRLVTVTFEDGTQELRLVEEDRLEFDDHDGDGPVWSGYRCRPELKDDEELVECVDGRILIARRPA